MTRTPAFDSIPTPTVVLGILRESRTSTDLVRAMMHLPHAVQAPRGRREPVLLLPGLGAGDGSMWMLGKFLQRLGWRVRGWELGVNRGDAPALLPRVVEVTERIAQRSGQPVRMVGWSMGGFLAREVARDRPDLVGQIITMGTPVVGGPKYTTLAAMMRRRGYDIETIAAECAVRACRPIDAPITAIYSRRDGIVAWQACIDRDSARVDHVEVDTTHFGLGWDFRVWRVVADRLASFTLPTPDATKSRGRRSSNRSGKSKRPRPRARPRR